MGMRHVETGLRSTGNPADSERADIISAMLKARGGDIPFPSVAEVNPVEKPAVITPETSFDIPTVSEAALTRKLPQEVRGIISMIMPEHASIPAQLDFAYQKRTGKALFTNWFGRTDDQTLPGCVAGVGRGDPTGGLSVLDWGRGSGGGGIFAFPVVVLPRKLAV